MLVTCNMAGNPARAVAAFSLHTCENIQRTMSFFQKEGAFLKIFECFTHCLNWDGPLDKMQT